MILCIPDDIGWLMIGSVWYQLGPGVGTWKVGGDGDRMSWLGVWVKVVDGVGNGILAGSTYIGKGGHTTGIGAGGASAGGAGAGAGAARGGAGNGWERKIEGPGS
jgi:hypothetical protein